MFAEHIKKNQLSQESSCEKLIGWIDFSTKN